MIQRIIVLTSMAAILLFATTGAAGIFDTAGVDIHGFVSQGYLLSDENNFLADTVEGTFQFNELGINFSKELTESLRIGVQLFARDFGDVGDNDVVIDWAYGDYHWRDWAGIRVGIMRLAHGFYNETRDIDMLRTSILLPQSIYLESRRDAFTRIQGAGVYGEIPLGLAGSLSYQAAIGASNLPEDGGVAREVENSGVFEVEDIDNRIGYNGSLQWRLPVEGLRIGVTGLRGTDLELTLRTTVPLSPEIPAGIGVTHKIDFWAEVFSAEYMSEKLTLAAEYMVSKTTDNFVGIRPIDSEKSEGYYLNAAYRLTDRLQIGAYYSEFYPDKDDKDGDRFTRGERPDHKAWQKDLAVSVRFDVTDDWIVKLEGHRMNGTGLLLDSDNPEGLEEDWYLFAAKVSFSF